MFKRANCEKNPIYPFGGNKWYQSVNIHSLNLKLKKQYELDRDTGHTTL